MKLKCSAHERRVGITDQGFVHKSDGSDCDTRRFILGNYKFVGKTPDSARKHIRARKNHRPGRKFLAGELT